MKKYGKFLSVFMVTLFFMSCSNENENFSSSCNNPDTEMVDVILQERNPNMSEVRTRDFVFEPKPGTNIIMGTKSFGPSGGIIGNSDVLLGYSYNVENGSSIMGDYDNVKKIIVDINKVKVLGSQYITPKQLTGNVTQSITYSSFDRYEKVQTSTKKVTSGFSIKIKLFSFGRKKTTTETFTSQVTNSNNSVYGELNLNIRNSSFALDGTENARKIYARQCLADTYMSNLYGTTIGDMLNQYGEFVMLGYVTGGKAFGLYAGNASEGSSMEKKEKDISTDINASFSWKSNSTSGNLNFGKGNSNLTSSGYSTKNTEIYLRTFGGDQTGQAVVGAVDLANMSLDLTSWLNSLSNRNVHTIIDILDGELYPMSYFVLEENFKKRFNDTYEGVLEKRTRLIRPYIEIVKCFVRTTSSGEPLYEVAAVLNTRQGDKIILSDGKGMSSTDAELRANETSSVFSQKMAAIGTEKKKYYPDIQIRGSAATKLNPAIRIPLCIRLDGFNEPSMYRYKNPKSGMEYIYDTTKRVAFAYYTDSLNEDWILDEYGIRDWVESLPYKSISMATLAGSYKIIGL